MPSGKTHRQATALLVGATVAASLTNPSLLYMTGGVAATLYLNPDLDLHHRLGKLGDLIGASYYRDLVPHRAGLRKKDWKYRLQNIFLFSHLPVLGTIPRFLIALLPLAATLLIFNLNLQIEPLLLIFLGMALSDTLHIIMDISWSFLRRIGHYIKREWIGAKANGSQNR